MVRPNRVGLLLPSLIEVFPTPNSPDSFFHGTHDNQEQEGDRWDLGESEDRWLAQRHGQEGRDPVRQQYAASPLTALSDPVAAYHGYPHSPIASHSRPEAPIPSTTHSYTTTTFPSPSPLVSESGMSRGNDMKPVPRAGSPYPYPFGHIRRKSYAGADNETMGLSQMDPNVFLSPSSTPLQYDPLTFLQTKRALSGRRGGTGDSQASTRSSPSHQHVPLPPFCRPRRRPKDFCRQSETRPPSCVESTQPRDTSPEFSSIEEEIASKPQQSVPHPTCTGETAYNSDEGNADDEKWIDENVGLEVVADDLLQLEFHPDYVGDPEKRRRRWQLRWETMLHNVSVLRDHLGTSDPVIWLDVASQLRALDRETNTAFVLLAAPSHTGKLHSAASRAVRRDSSPNMKKIRSAFAEITFRSHATHTASLLEQLSQARLSSRDGFPSSSRRSREKDLCRALDTAIGSLHALGALCKRQEMRWTQEKFKLDEDKEKVQLLLKQVLGASIFGPVGDAQATTPV